MFDSDGHNCKDAGFLFGLLDSEERGDKLLQNDVISPNRTVTSRKTKDSSQTELRPRSGFTHAQEVALFV